MKCEAVGSYIYIFQNILYCVTNLDYKYIYVWRILYSVQTLGVSLDQSAILLATFSASRRSVALFTWSRSSLVLIRRQLGRRKMMTTTTTSAPTVAVVCSSDKTSLVSRFPTLIRGCALRSLPSRTSFRRPPFPVSPWQVHRLVQVRVSTSNRKWRVLSKRWRHLTTSSRQ